MKLVDIHAHLDFKEFDEERESLVKQLEENNIKVYNNTLEPKSYQNSKKLFSDTPTVTTVPGFYPTEVEKASEEEINKFFQILEEEDYEFIGEVGLEGREGENLQAQSEFLERLLQFAIKNNKGVVIHTRKAEEETLRLLKKHLEGTNFRKVCLHCFTGKKKYYQEIKDLGIYCSIPVSVITAEQFQNLVNAMPVTKLLAETDSPFLNPGEGMNTPLNIPKVYDKIAELKGYDKQEIRNIIYNNYTRFKT